MNIYDPIEVVKPGSIGLPEDGGIVLNNWSFRMGNRPGQPTDYPCELMIAVREKVVALINAQIMLMSDEQFDDARIHQALITQIEHALGISAPKKTSFWKRIFKWTK